jgi:hypothetical protein
MKSSRAIVASALAGAIFAGALSASAAQFTTNGGGGVTKAEFERLQGQVQALEGRVAALERMSGHSGGGSGGGKGGKGGKGGHTAGDSWNH